MKKHIIFGGFDYAVLYEMDQNAILEGIDYFVETDDNWIGRSYLGKPIKHLNVLKEEDLDNILILVGSIVYKTELEKQLEALGLEKNKHFMWGIAFTGDEGYPRLWNHIEWSDKEKNAANLKMTEESEYYYHRMKMAASMVDWNRYDTVVDMGSANERLRAFVPEHVKYVPVDYRRYSEETVLCDLNQHQFPEKKYLTDKTVFFSIGNIMYCADWKWYLDTIMEHTDCLILTHDDFARVGREYRRTRWTRYNALFDHEIISYMQKRGYIMEDVIDFRLKSTIFKFVKGK